MCSLHSLTCLSLALAVSVMAGCARTMRGVQDPSASLNASDAAFSAATVVQRSTIGQSIEGRSIECFTFAGDPSLPPVLVFAGIHGDEPTTVAVARNLLELLREGRTGGPPVVVLPLVNPDGYERRTRTNARGVDLNRNFPAANFRSTGTGRTASGQSPLSEPESVALHALVERLRPARILTIHSIRPPKHGNNFDGPAQALAELLASKNGYAVLPTMGYATPGSFGSWAGVDLQIPTITLELPSNAPAERAWAENREALLAFVRGS